MRDTARTYQTTAQVCDQCHEPDEGDGDQGYSGCCNEPLITATVTVEVDGQGTSRIARVHDEGM
jgi:hypothetical protein